MDPRFSEETIRFLQLSARNAAAQSQGFEVNSFRRQVAESHEKINGHLMSAFQGTQEERVIKTTSTEIPITIYTPKNVDRTKLVIFFHGGGWVICSRQTHQSIVNMMADATNTVFINVEYRLGPEYKYPIWLDDAFEVTKEIIENKASYGVKSTAEVGVAGDSAGGLISASLARTMKADIAFQILIYAPHDILRTTPSYQEFQHKAYVLTPELMDWFQTNAYENEDVLKDPRVCSLANTVLEGVPPCLMIVADLDPLRDGSREYQKLLDKAGVKNKLVVIEGVIHSFFGLPGLFPEACGKAVESVREFLASLPENGSSSTEGKSKI